MTNEECSGVLLWTDDLKAKLAQAESERDLAVKALRNLCELAVTVGFVERGEYHTTGQTLIIGEQRKEFAEFLQAAREAITTAIQAERAALGATEQETE